MAFWPWWASCPWPFSLVVFTCILIFGHLHPLCSVTVISSLLCLVFSSFLTLVLGQHLSLSVSKCKGISPACLYVVSFRFASDQIGFLRFVLRLFMVPDLRMDQLSLFVTVWQTGWSGLSLITGQTSEWFTPAGLDIDQSTVGPWSWSSAVFWLTVWIYSTSTL